MWGGMGTPSASTDSSDENAARRGDADDHGLTDPEPGLRRARGPWRERGPGVRPLVVHGVAEVAGPRDRADELVEVPVLRLLGRPRPDHRRQHDAVRSDRYGNDLARGVLWPAARAQV